MKILVTGAHGQVGQAVIRRFSADTRFDVRGVSHVDVDISSHDDAFNIVSDYLPDVIVNAAAMTNVDACEEKIEDAFAINSLGVRNLTQAAERVNAHLIHTSTDFVFDGQMSRPYTEFDTTNPLSVYAASKLGGDNEALQYNKSTVLRVAWVFGNPGGDFFSWVIKGVREGVITSLIDDQIGTPTYSRDIADVAYHCVTHKHYGLFNAANSGETTRLEMGRLVCDRLGIEHNLTGITSDSLNRPAARPAYSALSSDVLARTTGIVMRSWQDALEEHLIDLKEELS